MSTSLDEAIVEISKHLGHDWKRLGRGLGFNKTDLDAIEVANPHVLHDQIDDLFSRWKRREGLNATVELLVVAAHTEGIVDILAKAGLSGISLESALDNPQRPIQCQNNSMRCPDDLVRQNNSVRPIQIQDDPIRPVQFQGNPQRPIQCQEDPMRSGPVQLQNSTSLRPIQCQNDPMKSVQLQDTPQRHTQSLDASVVVDRVPYHPEEPKANPNMIELREKRLKALGQLQSPPPPPPQPEKALNPCQDSCTITTTTTTPTKAASRLEKGDCAKVDFPDGSCVYGVVKSIEKLDINLNGNPQDCVGLEMDDRIGNIFPGSDGTFGGLQYFECNPGFGLFMPLDLVKHDDRFDDPTAPEATSPAPTPTLRSASCASHAPRNVPPTPIVLHEEPPAPTTATVTPLMMDRTMSTPCPPSDKPAPKRSPTDSTKSSFEGLLDIHQLLGELTLQHFPTLVFCFPGDQTGRLIGREGKNVKEVEELTSTKIKITGDRNNISLNGEGAITGSKENCVKAFVMLLTRVQSKINKQVGKRTEKIKLKGNKECGLVIGQGGSTLKSIRFLSGAKVKIDQDVTDQLLDLPRTCTITGTHEEVEKAKELIEKAIQREDITKPAMMMAMLHMLRSFMKEHHFQVLTSEFSF